MSRKAITTNRELRNTWHDSILATLVQRKILSKKKLLNCWYQALYDYVCKQLSPGINTVEIGAGSSFLFKRIPNLIKANILPIPDNDLVFDGFAMPFYDASFDNVILIDVLHHMAYPEKFFIEAKRILKVGGRILLIDPYISLLSYPMWKFMHPERCNLSRIGFDISEDHDPLKGANSATATLLFSRNKFSKINPGFKIIMINFHSKFSYWLAGGYNFPQLFPKDAWLVISAMEKALSPFDKWMASFMFVALEKI